MLNDIAINLGAGFSVVLQIVLFLLLILYVSFLSTSKMGIRRLRYSALCIWALGTVLYLYGFMHEEVEEGFVSMLLRAMLSSVELFVSHTDLLEIEEVQHEPYFLELFVFTYACAVVTSISALISLFGQRILTKLHLKYRKNERISHVFFGMDEKAFALAKSISDRGLPNGSKVAFVIFPDNEEAEKISMGHLLQGVIHGASKRFRIPTDSMLILNASHVLSDVDVQGDILSQIGLLLLKRHVDEDTIFYFLSDDKAQNVRHAIKFVKDPYFRNRHIVCRASKDGLNDYYKSALLDTNVHFVYPGTMVSQDLSSNIGYHPVTVVDVVRDSQGRGMGCIEGGFNGWVIGFGETGQTTAHILYEYSNFLHEDGSAAPSRLTIFDDNMDMIEGVFRAGVPGVDHSRITYEQTKIGSTAFWKKLSGEVDQINYIAITLGDDERNMEMACMIARYVGSMRKEGWRNLKMVVRCARCVDRHRELLHFLDQSTGGGHILAYGEYRKAFTAENMLSTNMAGISDDFTRRGAELSDKLFEVMGVDDSFENHNRAFAQLKKEHKFTQLMQELRLLGQNISAYNFSATMQRLFEGHEDAVADYVADGTHDDPQAALLAERAARCEQMRRLASLQMFGFSKSAADEDTSMRLASLQDWDQLPEHSRKYYLVRAKVMMRIGRR